MRLLVVSHTPHFRRDGQVVGFGPTVRELDRLAGLFDRLVHLAPLYDRAPAIPPSALPYSAENLELRPLRPAGGPKLVDKLGVLLRYPGYLAAFVREMRRADVVHVRCPSNVSLLAIVAMAPGWRPWWVKYAGSWRRSEVEGREPATHTLQRFWLSRRWPRLALTVNGHWPEQPEWVTSFENPCLSRAELVHARGASAQKELGTPVRLLFVGNLDRNKGPDRAVRALARVVAAGVEAELDLAGDGAERASCEALAAELGVAERVRFHGALPRPALDPLYGASHLLLLPSGTEGWPKVVGEAMAWGVVPIASAVSWVPQSFERMGMGRAIPPLDVDGFARAVLDYAADRERWRVESDRARQSVDHLTYDHYLDSVRRLFAEQWTIDLPQRA